MALRARIILMLAKGFGPAEIARELGCADRTVRKWRGRWNAVPTIAALFDRPRSGRPKQIDALTRCEIIRLACAQAAERVAFRTIWTQQAIADALELECGIVVSRSTIQRVLAAEGLRPHRVRQWLHSPDPEFRSKVRRICDIYMHPPDDAIVLCIDEKPMQALSLRHPIHVGHGGVIRREFEYARHGTCALLGALDIRSGRVFGRVVHHRDATNLVRFLDAIARRHPGRRVIVIWDNLNIHHDGRDQRWLRFNERHGGRFEFLYTPIHASWVNQIELWFSVLQRRVLRNASFASRAQLATVVESFIAHWNRLEARPFHWTFDGRFPQTHARAA